jgi:hypothetical protein
MQKDISDRCRRGYSRMETINETYVDELTDALMQIENMLIQMDNADACVTIIMIV